MKVDTLINVRLLAPYAGFDLGGAAALAPRATLFSVSIANGRIAAVTPQTGALDAEALPDTPGEEGIIDADGGLLTVALVDPHLHLDLAYSQEIVPENKSGTLLEAIDLWAAAKREISAEDVCERAMRAIGDEVAFGTGAIRSHVDTGSAAQQRLTHGVLAAREATKGLVAIQFVAFPQDGLIRDPGAVDNTRAALKSGVDVVGGIPHIERTQRDGLAHLDIVFQLAREFDADIDVHIDETDDPYSVYVEHLAALTLQHGWMGRVTASHVCALASYPDVHASRVISLLAEAQISVVTNPGVNLHLQGRFDTYPKRRGLTRVSELLARGVLCAAGQDCIRDPFYPLGNGNMLDQAFLLAHADHLSTPARLRAALEMVSGMAARVTRLGAAEVAVGQPAHLALFDAHDAADLVRLRPRPVCVIHGGTVVAGTAVDSDPEEMSGEDE